MLHYEYDFSTIHIKEITNDTDIEFQIAVKKPDTHCTNLKKVHQHYKYNNDYTDVLFYFYNNNEYHVIVKPNYYNDFILTLMKFELLQNVQWNKEPQHDVPRLQIH